MALYILEYGNRQMGAPVSEGDPPRAAILLIDDDHRVVESLGGLIRSEGYELTIAMTAEDGLEAFYSLLPPVVVSDHDLQSSFDGVELLFEIAQRHPDVRRILISGMVMFGDLKNAKGSGIAHQVLSKSDFHAILEAVREEVEKATAG